MAAYADSVTHESEKTGQGPYYESTFVFHSQFFMAFILKIKAIVAFQLNIWKYQNTSCRLQSQTSVYALCLVYRVKIEYYVFTKSKCNKYIIIVQHGMTKQQCTDWTVYSFFIVEVPDFHSLDTHSCRNTY